MPACRPRQGANEVCAARRPPELFEHVEEVVAAWAQIALGDEHEGQMPLAFNPHGLAAFGKVGEPREVLARTANGVRLHAYTVAYTFEPRDRPPLCSADGGAVFVVRNARAVRWPMPNASLSRPPSDAAKNGQSMRNRLACRMLGVAVL